MVEGGGMQPGMMYMPMSPHHGLSPHSLGHPQQQWPLMPWMGPYFMHPSQHTQPEPINLMAAGRSTSAPENPASLSWASQPMQTSGAALLNCVTLLQEFTIQSSKQCTGSNVYRVYQLAYAWSTCWQHCTCQSCT